MTTSATPSCGPACHTLWQAGRVCDHGSLDTTMLIEAAWADATGTPRPVVCTRCGHPEIEHTAAGRACYGTWHDACSCDAFAAPLSVIERGPVNQHLAIADARLDAARATPRMSAVMLANIEAAIAEMPEGIHPSNIEVTLRALVDEVRRQRSVISGLYRQLDGEVD